jgi:uncharacterized membrane protein
VGGPLIDPQAAEWLDLLLRWLHITTGAAWIGTSFYFNWLNNHVRAPDEARPGVAGELWAVHGGAFYQVSKFAVAPERLPCTLHWFKWEAYFTWISGFCLLVLVYYMGGDAWLLDVGEPALSKPAAVALGIGSLVVGWFVYDALCRSPLVTRPVLFAAVCFALAAGVALLLTRYLGSRAAYIHVGAMLGTLMAANVFRVIIPGQRVMVDAMSRGAEPDPRPGLAGARRSLHNNYMTLPVLFIMVSNHYPMTYGHTWNWVILAALALIGAGVRHWFNLRGQGRRNAWILPAAAVAMVALALAAENWRTSGGVTAAGAGSGAPVDVAWSEVQAIVAVRCVTCHSAAPASPLFADAPAGVTFDSRDDVEARLDGILATAVESRVMPLGNLTGMTDEERVRLGAWIRSRLAE